MFWKFKKIYSLLFLFIMILAAFKVSAFFSKKTASVNFSGMQKNITLDDNGLSFKITTPADKIIDLLKEEHIQLSGHDKIIPGKDTSLYPGINIRIRHAFPVKILVDNKTLKGYAFGITVKKALEENQITLSHLDKTSPGLDALIENNLTIIITRINVENIVKEEEIAFKTIVEINPKLGWREKKIKQPGVKGTKKVEYRITYRNGKKISQLALNSKITQASIPQIETHGAYIKLGKSQKGQGTWYVQPLYLKQLFSPLVDNFAASTSLPKGSYAKVTNSVNGKSIIVQINDYGPRGKKRIIDLDKKAFAKIASIGEGVIAVKVSPILN